MELYNPNSGSWRLYAISLICCFVMLLALNWSAMPTFIDIYYHLSVMLGFNEIGGFTTTAFWEYAPVGRAHLYPPLIHILMLIFYKSNFSALTVARLFEFIMYSATLITLWWTVARLFNKRLAFFTILISSSAFSFYLSIINFIPASLALNLSLLSFIFLEKKKILASSILLGLAFYSHAGIPWIFLLSFILYALLNRRILKDCLKVIFYSLIISSPLLIYQYASRRYVELSRTIEGFPLEINLWLFLLFIPGLIISFKRKERYSFFISLFIINLLLICTNYRYRFISGQGILGLIFLSSVALDRAYEKLVVFMAKKPSLKLNAVFVFVLFLICFLFLSPTILIHKKNLRFHTLNSTYINLVPSLKKIDRPHDVSVYFPRFYNPINDIIVQNSTKDDIIFCNMEFVAEIFSVMTGRVTSCAMLGEIMPYKRFDPIAVSKIIIWIKNPDGSASDALDYIVKKYNLKKIKETEIAFIYKNEKATAKRILPRPLLSDKLLFFILFLSVGLIGFDIVKK